MNKHFFLIQENQVKYLSILYMNKIDNQYYVIAESGKYSDIAQYSEKYDCVSIKTVLSENLDRLKQLVA